MQARTYIEGIDSRCSATYKGHVTLGPWISPTHARREATSLTRSRLQIARCRNILLAALSSERARIPLPRASASCVCDAIFCEYLN